MTNLVNVRHVQLSVATAVLIIASAAAAQGEGGASLEVTVGSPGGASSFEQNVQSLASTDPAARLAAARALGELGDARAVGPLSQTARSDPRPEVRGWALRSLQQLGTPEAVAVVREVAQADADERVRALAAQLASSAPAAPPAASAAPAPAATPAPPPPAAAPAPAAAGQQGPASASATVVVQAQPGAPGQPAVSPQPMGQPAQHVDPYTMMRQRRAGRGLRIGGWVTFGTFYFISFMAGIGVSATDGADEGWPLLVPGIGPFIMGARLISDAERCDFDVCYEDSAQNAAGVVSILAGLIQVGGIAMLTAGYVRRSRVARRGYSNERRRPRRFAVLPGGPGDSVGMNVSGTF